MLGTHVALWIPTPSSRFWREQLHALAIASVQAKDRLAAAVEASDLLAAAAEQTNLRNLGEAFLNVRAQFLAAMEREDPTGLDWTEQSILAIGSVVAAVPEALTTVIVNGLLRPLEELLKELTKTAARATYLALLPVVGIALLAIGLVAVAERTRTGRRLAARV